MKFCLYFLLCVFIFSCSAKKDIRYFEDIGSKEYLSSINYVPTVYQPNDLIIIRVSSPDNVGVESFNLTETSYVPANGLGSVSTTARPYLVLADGTIDFPVLGKIKIAGLKKEDVLENIRQLLLPYINEPRVNIEMVNFKISILGDVGSPGVYQVENERITILEAIAMAGDLNITGKRGNILIVREDEDKKKFIRANILTDSIFNSTAYYLKQNDVVYVEPNALKTREASWESRIPIFTSIIAFSLSIYTFFIR